MSFIYFLCRKKLDLSTNHNKANGYITNQTHNYSESAFLELEKRHLATCNEGMDLSKKSYFSFDFPFDEVLDELKKIIPNEKGLYTGFFVDTYIFKYDNCGRADDHVVDYFKVVCFHNTNKFIALMPAYGYDNYIQTDLNYLNKKNTKRISMVDKFNKRYNSGN